MVNSTINFAGISIRLLVTKFDETFLFYRDVLGFKVTWGNVGENYAQFDVGGSQTLSLFYKNIMAGVLGTVHLPAQVLVQDRVALIFAVDDVDGFYASLSTKGIAFMDEPVDQVDWGVRVVHLRDPDENLLEFIADI